MSAKTYQRILQIGIFLSLAVVFLVFKGLLFPYISSKQFSFNILMELLFPFWLIMVWKFPSYRPQKSLITWGLIAYLVVILISAFTGVDFNLSFWGNIERMLGLFSVFHFFLFYLYLISAFRKREDWHWLLSASVLAAFIESFLVFSGVHLGSIGNTAYVSGYFIFNVYFSLILFNNSKGYQRWLYILAIIPMLIAFLMADTSGAIIGIGSSLLLFVFLLGLFAAKKKHRRLAVGLLLGLVIVIGGLFSQYQKPWFQNNRALHNLSIYKNTFQTRLISWEGAVKDFHLHPWLGTGYANYAITFDRQFQAKFFNYATTGTYFDHAHNNLIDITSTTGVIGLAAYLSIFLFTFFDWRKAKKKWGKYMQTGLSRKRLLELFLFASLILAYFVQNLAVFDSLVTYMGLMMALAYLVFLARSDKEGSNEEEGEYIEERIEETKVSRSWRKGKEVFGLFILLILSLSIIWTYNVLPMKSVAKVIEGYHQILSQQYAEGFDTYRQAFSYPSHLDRNSRTTLINAVIANPIIFTKMPIAVAKDNLDYVISLAQKNLAYNPQDSLMNMQLAQLYDIASRYFAGDSEMFQNYSNKALEYAQASLKASPQRIPVYFVVAQIEANRGELDAAKADLIKAYNLNPDYYQPSCQLANFYALTEASSVAQPYIDKCLDGGGQNMVDAALNAAVSHYLSTKDNTRLLLAYRALAKKYPDSASDQAQLAQAEFVAGNIQAALTAAMKAANLDPTLKPAVDQFIKAMKEAQASSTPSR